MKLKALILFIGLIVMGQSQAGLLIDPYIGFGQAKSSADVVGAKDSTDSYSAVGSRLGYSFLLFSAGIDYEMAKIKNDAITNTSIFVGFDFPILVRAWAEYFVSSKLDTTTDFTFKDGYGIGFGFTGLPFVSLNLEINALRYNYTVGSTEIDYAVGSTLLSVSMPFNL